MLLTDDGETANLPSVFLICLYREIRVGYVIRSSHYIHFNVCYCTHHDEAELFYLFLLHPFDICYVVL